MFSNRKIDNTIIDTNITKHVHRLRFRVPRCNLYIINLAKAIVLATFHFKTLAKIIKPAHDTINHKKIFIFNYSSFFLIWLDVKIFYNTLIDHICYLTNKLIKYEIQIKCQIKMIYVSTGMQ